MSEYLVSARKYRPLKFENVIGQEHVTTTLNNAIQKNQIAHAYLFCGPRGVGKTTCARIFAQLINENTHSEYNIFELDGASNNSVDDIRTLIEQVKIPPQIGKYKTYIIDEVHMLSKSAFNAFLKTLEEPPKHSIFILATTEKEKIIPTILSRCQIFDFNRISNQQISAYLLKLSQKEKIQVNEKTIQLIAEKSDGSLRDALSIFDKIYTFCNNLWEHEEVSKILLSLDVQFASQLTQHIIKQDIHNCLIEVNKVLDKGYDGKEVVKVLIHHFRNLMMLKDSQTKTLINAQKDILETMMNQAQKLSNEQIILALSCLSECDINYHKSINQRFFLELCIMKLCSLSKDILKKKLLISPPKTKNTEINGQQSDKLEKTDTEVPKKMQKKVHVYEKNPINSDLISITEELHAMKEENATTISKSKRNNEWSKTELLNKWHLFSKKLQKKQKTNLHNMFERYTPVKRNNTIMLELVSLSEKAEIEEIKLELLSFMKQELKNDFLEIILNISKEKKKNMLHTKEEKYAYIINKNQNIKLLKDKLDLTII